jgi:hypothetical protein
MKSEAVKYKQLLLGKLCLKFLEKNDISDTVVEE